MKTRQTDRQTDEWTDRKTLRKIDRWKDRQTVLRNQDRERVCENQTDRQAGG